MITNYGFDTTLNRKCNILGTAFELSVKQYGYNSYDFVRKVMTDRKLDWLFEIDDCQEWCDGYYLMSILNYYEKFRKGNCVDDYAMWCLGYLYKYWMSTRGTPRHEIYRILTPGRFLRCFDPYLDMPGWDAAIDEVVKRFKPVIIKTIRAEGSFQDD